MSEKLNFPAKTASSVPTRVSDLTNDERRAYEWWLLSEGSVEKFLVYAKSDEKFIGLLLSEKLAPYIAKAVEDGKCAPLAMTKGEVSLRMTSLGRKNDLRPETQLSVLEGIAKLGGMYPANQGGPSPVTIVLTGKLGE